MEKEEKELDPMQRNEAFLWAMLRSIYLRVECRHAMRVPADLTDSEANAILDPWFDAMRTDLDILMECLRHVRALGSGEAREQLHVSQVQVTQSHELLDQVLDPTGIEESPGMIHPRHGFL
jgi:hypothetical protein